MATIRAAVMPSPNAPIELRDIPEPDLEPGAALLAVTCSEVCGTDVHLRDGRLAGVPYPIIPGHVATGVLAKIRGEIHDVSGQRLHEGDAVTFLDVHGTCGACWQCLVGKASTRCPKRKVYGITYGLEDGPCGGWADRLLLKPGVRCIRLDGVDPFAFMAGGCSLPTALHAIDLAHIRIAETVLVLGSGPVGLSTAAFARMQGAGQVLVIGAPEARLLAARAMGATDVLEFATHPVDQRRDWVLARTDGRGADVTIEATGNPNAVVEALRFTRDAGRVVVVGQYTDHGDVALNPHLDVNKKHLEIRGCWGSDYSHFHRAVEVLRHESLGHPWRSLPTERHALEQAQTALDRVASSAVLKALIVP